MRWLFGALTAFACTTASAADLPSPAPVEVSQPVERAFSVIDEVRIGGSYITNENRKNDDETGYIQAEFLFAPLNLRVFENEFLNSYFNVRFTVGGTLSPTGGTNMGYAGLTWESTFTQILSVFDLIGVDARPSDTSVTDRLFYTSFFGGAIHDGEVDEDDDDERHYGCRVNFRESAGLGYKITESVRVIGFWAHMSNAGLCSDNDGITQVGASLGLKF